MNKGTLGLFASSADELFNITRRMQGKSPPKIDVSILHKARIQIESIDMELSSESETTDEQDIDFDMADGSDLDIQELFQQEKKDDTGATASVSQTTHRGKKRQVKKKNIDAAMQIDDSSHPPFVPDDEPESDLDDDDVDDLEVVSDSLSENEEAGDEEEEEEEEEEEDCSDIVEVASESEDEYAEDEVISCEADLALEQMAQQKRRRKRLQQQQRNTLDNYAVAPKVCARVVFGLVGLSRFVYRWLNQQRELRQRNNKRSHLTSG